MTTLMFWTTWLNPCIYYSMLWHEKKGKMRERYNSCTSLEVPKWEGRTAPYFEGWGVDNLLAFTPALCPFPRDELQELVWFKLRETHSPGILGIVWGVEDKKVDVLDYKSWLTGCLGLFRCFPAVIWHVKSGITVGPHAVSWPIEWHQRVTNGVDMQRETDCVLPLNSAGRAQLIGSTEQHTHSRSQLCSHALTPPLWAGQWAAARQPNKHY